MLTFIEEIGATDIENEPVKAIYKKYKEFCLSNQFEPLNRIEFSRQVGKALNFTTKDKRVMGEKVKVFVQKVLDVPDSVPDA